MIGWPIATLCFYQEMIFDLKQCLVERFGLILDRPVIKSDADLREMLNEEFKCKIIIMKNDLTCGSPRTM